MYDVETTTLADLVTKVFEDASVKVRPNVAFLAYAIDATGYFKGEDGFAHDFEPGYPIPAILADDVKCLPSDEVGELTVFGIRMPEDQRMLMLDTIVVDIYARGYAWGSDERWWKPGEPEKIRSVPLTPEDIKALFAGTLSKCDIVIRHEHVDQNPVEPNVNAPDHYLSGSLECKDWIRAMMTEEEYEGYLKGCALKYLWRYRGKGKPVQDLRKAGAYVGFLVDELRERGEEA